MIHDSVWWVGGLPIEMAGGHACLTPSARPPTVAGKVWSTARERTLYGIPGKPEVNEVDWQVQMGTSILANVPGCGPRQFLSTSGMAQFGDSEHHEKNPSVSNQENTLYSSLGTKTIGLLVSIPSICTRAQRMSTGNN